MKRLFITFVCSLVLSMAFAFDKNDVTMVSYEQGWSDDNGTIALRNNTDKEVKRVTFEITYLDMKGNALDYEEYTERVSIEPGKTKKVDIPAYEHDRSYHYYLTPEGFDNPRFKIKYELKDYSWDEPKDEVAYEETDSYGALDRIGDSDSFDYGGIWAIVIACVAAMVMLGIAVGFYVLVAVLAKNRHRNVLLWVLLSILASPVLIAIILLVIGKANDYEEASQDFH